MRASVRRCIPKAVGQQEEHMALNGNQAIYGLRITIVTGDDGLRAGSQAVLNLTFVDGFQSSLPLNDGDNWQNGTTHQVTIGLPDAPRAKDIATLGVSFTSGSGISGDNWNMSGFMVEVLIDSSTWFECIDEYRAPYIQRFTGSVREWFTPFVYASEYAAKVRNALVQQRSTVAVRVQSQVKSDIGLPASPPAQVALQLIARQAAIAQEATAAVGGPTPQA
jgi:hypothetical protein